MQMECIHFLVNEKKINTDPDNGIKHEVSIQHAFISIR